MAFFLFLFSLSCSTKLEPDLELEDYRIQISENIFAQPATDGEMWIFDHDSRPLFRAYILDNSPDPVSEGFFRIRGENGQVGFADLQGKIIYDFQFICATFPL